MRRTFSFKIFLLLIIVSFIFPSCNKDTKYVDSYVIIKDGLYGLIDSVGNEIVPPQFLYIEPIRKDGVALAVLDIVYTSVQDSTYFGDQNKSFLNIKYGYITSENKFIFPKPSYAKIPIKPYSDSYLAFSNFCDNFSFYGGMAVAQDTTTNLYGYIGLNGDTIISAQYLNAKIFNNGRAAVQLNYNETDKSSGKWGLINPNNEKVCDFVFASIETPINNRAIASIFSVRQSSGVEIEGEIAKDDDGNIYIDKTKAQRINPSDSPTFSTLIFLVDEDGKIVNENMSMTYHYSNFSNDGIAVAIPNKLGAFFGVGYSFINKEGEFLQPLDINQITEEKAESLIKSKYFLNELLPKDIEFFDATRFTNGYAAVNLGNAWVFVDKELIPRGNEDYPIFEDALPFSNGLAAVKIDGKYGYIDANFNISIPCKYDSCAVAGKNLCRVYSGNTEEDGYSIISYINRENKVVWQTINYNTDYISLLEKFEKPTNGKWRNEIAYNYIGKDYTVVWVFIVITLISILLIIWGRKRRKRQSRKNALNESSHIKETKPNETKMHENISEKNSEIIKEENKIDKKKEMSSQADIDERLNDILKF